MAYSFNGTSQYLSSTTTPVTAPPFTISALVNPSSVAAAGIVVAISNATNSDRHNLAIIAGGTITASSTVNNISASSTSTTTIATNTWSNMVGVYRTTANRQGYLNGVAIPQNTQTSAPVVGRMQIGVRFITGNNAYFSGRLAEVGIWSAGLTEEEITALSLGISPSLIRPQSLAFYAPLLRNLVDLRGNRSLTNTNTATVSVHPRIYL